MNDVYRYTDTGLHHVRCDHHSSTDSEVQMMYEKRKDYLIDEALALKTYKITFVDVLDNGTAGLATVRAENQAEAEKKFEAQNDGCAIVIIKEQR